MNVTPRKLFTVFNYIVLTLLGLACLLPILHILAISLSSSAYVSAGEVNLIPIGLTLKAYDFVANRPEFIRAFQVSLFRVALGLSLNIFLAITSAYVLSKEPKTFRWRTFYVWYFIITTLFNGGLIPGFLVVRATGLINSIWALVLPGAVQTFCVILLMNFFRGLPKEMEEAACIDGAGHIRMLIQIFIPTSTPAIATITLLMIVFHWNSWFDGLIFMNRPENYPLQSYLQTVIISPDLKFSSSIDIEVLKTVSERTSRAAQIFLGTLPILIVYPLLQKYFMKGLVFGSVKG